jgi:hypothetical protein
MEWAALISWIVPAGGGFALLAPWLSRGGPGCARPGACALQQKGHGRPDQAAGAVVGLSASSSRRISVTAAATAATPKTASAQKAQR